MQTFLTLSKWKQILRDSQWLVLGWTPEKKLSPWSLCVPTIFLEHFPSPDTWLLLSYSLLQPLLPKPSLDRFKKKKNRPSVLGFWIHMCDIWKAKGRQAFFFWLQSYRDIGFFCIHGHDSQQPHGVEKQLCGGSTWMAEALLVVAPACPLPSLGWRWIPHIGPVQPLSFSTCSWMPSPELLLHSSHQLLL